MKFAPIMVIGLVTGMTAAAAAAQEEREISSCNS